MRHIEIFCIPIHYITFQDPISNPTSHDNTRPSQRKTIKNGFISSPMNTHYWFIVPPLITINEHYYFYSLHLYPKLSNANCYQRMHPFVKAKTKKTKNFWNCILGVEINSISLLPNSDSNMTFYNLSAFLQIGSRACCVNWQTLPHLLTKFRESHAVCAWVAARCSYSRLGFCTRICIVIRYSK